MTDLERVRKDWSARPADLGEWAMRAATMLNHAEKAEAELARLREAAQRLVDYVQSVGSVDWSDTVRLRIALQGGQDE